MARLIIQADSVEVDHTAGDTVRVDIRGFNLSDLVNEIGVEDLLDEIGRGDCIDHFDIKEDTGE